MERNYLGRIKGHMISISVQNKRKISEGTIEFTVCSLMDESIDVSDKSDGFKWSTIFKPDIRIKWSHGVHRMIDGALDLGYTSMFGMIREHIKNGGVGVGRKSVLSTVNKSAVLRGLQR